MEKRMLKFAALVTVGVCAVQLAACSGGGTVLGKPEAHSPLSYQERQQLNLETLEQSADAFSAAFSAAAYRQADGNENFAVAPVSVYMALSLAAECASGETRQQILSALGVSYQTLSTDFGGFYRSLLAEHTDGNGKVSARSAVGNSVWIDERATAKEDCVQTLAERYYCYSYAADFQEDNGGANRAVREFVKEQTNGLIDKDFQLSADTVFTLINTLYLKDIWNEYGNDMPFTEQEYDFTQSDGATVGGRLLQGDYRSGRVYRTETYSHFYTETRHGYRLKFILPEQGYSVSDVFSAETIAAVNAVSDYGAYDEANKLHYNTRCLFPEFSASFDEDVKEILQSFGIESLFDPDSCDFGTLTDDEVYCSAVRHVTKLAVDRKGIEGAAATVMQMEGAGAPFEDEYTEVYEDFTVNGAFGFILTDPYGNALFTGVINRI